MSTAFDSIRSDLKYRFRSFREFILDDAQPGMLLDALEAFINAKLDDRLPVTEPDAGDAFTVAVAGAIADPLTKEDDLAARIWEEWGHDRDGCVDAIRQALATAHKSAAHFYTEMGLAWEEANKAEARITELERERDEATIAMVDMAIASAKWRAEASELAGRALPKDGEYVCFTRGRFNEMVKEKAEIDAELARLRGVMALVLTDVDPDNSNRTTSEQLHRVRRHLTAALHPTPEPQAPVSSASSRGGAAHGDTADRGPETPSATEPEKGGDPNTHTPAADDMGHIAQPAQGDVSVPAPDVEARRMKSLVEAHARAYVAQVYDTVSFDELPEQRRERIRRDSRAILAAVLPMALAGPRKVLVPFAKSADAYEPDEGDDEHRAWASDFTIGDLRRARSELTRINALIGEG